MNQDISGVEKWKDEPSISRLDSSLDDPFGRRLSLYENNRTFPRSPPKRATKTQKFASSEIRKASFEYPLSYSPKDGLQLAKGGRLSVLNTFSIDERWNASFHGSSVMRGSTGYTTTQGDVNYRIGSSGSVRGGLIVGEHKEVVLGGRTGYGKSHVSATLTTRASHLSKWRTSLSVSHIIGKGTIRTSASLHSSRPANYLLSFASATRHKWQVGVGVSMERPLLSLNLSPQLSTRRLLNLSTTWRGKAGWQVGVVLTLKSAAQIGVGVWRYSSKGVSWVFSWTDNELSIRVPIMIGSSATNLWFTSLQMLYLSILSHAINDVVGRAFSLGKDSGETGQLKERSIQIKRKTAHIGALQQQALMKRQAESRKVQEEEKNGLIIQKAVYHIQGGDQFDVTVPMQFWVSDSLLELPESSKKNLLGFYDISIDQQVETEPDLESSWLAGFWKPPMPAEDSNMSKNSPRLSIRYKFSGVDYEITIQDLECVSLPSTRAKLVSTPNVK